MTNNEEEYELLRKVYEKHDLNGECADELIRMYTPMMNKLVSDALGLFPWARTYRDDLMQEARISFYKLIFSYDESKGVKFSTFVYFCLRRSIRGSIRKYYRRSPEMFCTEYNEEYETIENSRKVSIDYHSPDYIYKYNMTKEKYEEFISNLPDLQMKVFNLYLDDYSYKEIASELDIGCKKVDNIIAGIKRKLKDQVIDLF